jgi:hypothetical protein
MRQQYSGGRRPGYRSRCRSSIPRPGSASGLRALAVATTRACAIGSSPREDVEALGGVTKLQLPGSRSGALANTRPRAAVVTSLQRTGRKRATGADGNPLNHALTEPGSRPSHDPGPSVGNRVEVQVLSSTCNLWLNQAVCTSVMTVSADSDGLASCCVDGYLGDLCGR